MQATRGSKRGRKKYASTLLHAPARRKERQIAPTGDKGSVAEVIGYLKGERPIRMAEKCRTQTAEFCRPQILGEAPSGFGRGPDGGSRLDREDGG